MVKTKSEVKILIKEFTDNNDRFRTREVLEHIRPDCRNINISPQRLQNYIRQMSSNIKFIKSKKIWERV